MLLGGKVANKYQRRANIRALTSLLREEGEIPHPVCDEFSIARQTLERVSSFGVGALYEVEPGFAVPPAGRIEILPV